VEVFTGIDRLIDESLLADARQSIRRPSGSMG
jgi:hypothetical protein